MTDEFALLADNAAEAGLPYDQPAVVSRRSVRLPDGRQQSALVWGDGPAEVVAVHGSGQNAHTWDTVALRLGVPLVAVDLAGHGHSDWREDHDYAPSKLAGDLAVTLPALAPEARLVVGMSLGGLTCLALAAAHPELVPRLLLVDITPGVNQQKASAVHEFMAGPERFATFDEILERTVTYNPTRTESSLRRGVTHNAKQLPDGSWTWRWDNQRRFGSRSSEELAALWRDVAGVTVPLTLVRGGQSRVVDDDDVAEFRRLQPGADVIVVEGAGHSIQGDRPVELADIIKERY